MAKGSVTL